MPWPVISISRGAQISNNVYALVLYSAYTFLHFLAESLTEMIASRLSNYTKIDVPVLQSFLRFSVYEFISEFLAGPESYDPEKDSNTSPILIQCLI